MQSEVGKTAYWVYEYDGKYHVYDDLLVVRRVSKDEIGIHYSMENAYEDIIDWCRAEDVFENIKVAEEICKERNMKNGCQERDRD